MHWEIATNDAPPTPCWCGLTWSHTPAERAPLAVDVWPEDIPKPRSARSHAALTGFSTALSFANAAPAL